MAYLRGEVYIWDDGGRVHIWAENGKDGMAVSSWAEGRPEAAGVMVSQRAMDEYVVMRHAELLMMGELAKVRRRALKHGNSGGEALAHLMAGPGGRE